MAYPRSTADKATKTKCKIILVTLKAVHGIPRSLLLEELQYEKGAKMAKMAMGI